MANTQLTLSRALKFHKAGQLDKAEPLYRQVLALQPSQVVALRQLATLCRQTRRYPEAAALLKRAAELQPQNPDVLLELGGTLITSGQAKEAVAPLRQATELRPDSAAAWFHLGQAQSSTFNTGGAVAALKKAVQLDPQNPDAHAQLGVAFLNHGLAPKAVRHLVAARRARPNSPDLANNLALAQRLIGDYDAALVTYDESLRLRPGDPYALAGQAEIHETRKNYDRVREILEPAVAKPDVNPHIASVFARCSKRLGRQAEAVDVLKRVIGRPDTPRHFHCMLDFSLGQVYEDLGEYDLAFAAYREGNDLYPKDFDSEDFHRLNTSLIESFSAERLRAMPRSTVESDLPIFIVGMPRSGTSLIEQILASHPEVFGAGELQDIIRHVNGLHRRIGTRRRYPECADEITAAVLDEVARAYLERVREMAPDARRVTDKMPHNFMHLGLISRLFPGGRVIHCRRNPLDTCLSCYTTQLSPVHNYATDLASLGIAYREYRRLMDHWKAVMDVPILDVVYEQVTAEQEAQSRRLVDFAGLEWNDACLAFYETKRLVNTASIDQATKPMYRTSVARHKRFEKHLGPLIETLGPYAEQPY